MAERIEVGQVFRVEGHVSRLAELKDSGAILEWQDGWSGWYHRCRLNGTRLDGHPWEADPDWREGDEYDISFNFDVVQKVRGGEVLAQHGLTGSEPRPRFVPTEWGEALRFTPKWRPVEASVPPGVNEPKPLARAELITAVQERCPEGLRKAAWDYAVTRYAECCDRASPEFESDWSTEDVSEIVGSLNPGGPGATRWGERFYLDGLRQAALDAMPCPDGHDPERWRRKCMGYIEDEVNHTIDMTSHPERGFLEDVIAKRFSLFPDTVDPGPSGKWWQGASQRVEVRGHHGEDSEAA